MLFMQGDDKPEEALSLLDEFCWQLLCNVGVTHDQQFLLAHKPESS